MVRVAAALFCVSLGLWTGYALWGMPAAGLGEALERLTIENDQLRTRLAEAVRERRDPVCDISGSIDTILRRLGEQSESLNAQTQAIATIGTREVERTIEEQLKVSLQECDVAQTRMQEQLEDCLFAKADAERAAATARKAAERPRAGTQTVTETIDIPKIPGATDGGAPGQPSVPIDARAVKPALSAPAPSSPPAGKAAPKP